jgi:2-keto-4-pentenoate hydratase
VADDAVTRGMQTLLARRAGDLASGARQVGWKIGFNTAAIQQALGISEPVVGYLLDRNVLPDGATVSLAGWGKPALEVEVAIRVGDDLDVAGLAPALELVDLDVSFADLELVLAANICQRGVVFGPEVPGVDPWAVVATATNVGANADETGSGDEGRLAEDPATTVAFVRRFVAAHGAALEPGQRIIAGSLLAPIALAPGDALDVDFGPLGRLSVRFTD